MDPYPSRWLLPLSFLYGAIIRLRNILYDFKLCRSYKANLPVICVGNITVGGTGKTPMVEYLLNNLVEHYTVSLLSRGYKRKTRGFVVAGTSTKVHEIGDEPFQIHSKYPEVTVSVCERRWKGIQIIRKLLPETNVIVMDDGMQHRQVTPGLLICLIDYNRPIWEDKLMPSGRLREPVKELRRANIIVVTKCPTNLTQEEQAQWKEEIQKYNSTSPVFFTSVNYADQLNNLTKETARIDMKDIQECYLFTGIANPQPLYDYLEANNIRYEFSRFPDHHHFTYKDIQELDEISVKYSHILTTEKDAGRLSSLELPANLINKIYAIAIQTVFLNDQGEEFNELIYEYLDTFSPRT